MGSPLNNLSLMYDQNTICMSDVESRWAIINDVLPSCRWNRPFWITFSVRVSTLLIVSSRMSLWGWATMARAMVSVLFPWERLVTPSVRNVWKRSGLHDKFKCPGLSCCSSSNDYQNSGLRWICLGDKRQDNSNNQKWHHQDENVLGSWGYVCQIMWYVKGGLREKSESNTGSQGSWDFSFPLHLSHRYMRQRSGRVWWTVHMASCSSSNRRNGQASGLWSRIVVEEKISLLSWSMITTCRTPVIRYCIRYSNGPICSMMPKTSPM